LKTKGIYLLYRALQILGLPFLLFYFLARGVRDFRYIRSLRQRFGFLPHSFKQTVPGAIWLHAVSVGEVLSLLEFARQVRAQFPGAPLYVSTTTIAGKVTADEKLSGLAAGVFYAPVDYVFALRRVLRRLRPAVVVVAETEIWPNLFRETRRIGAGLIMINGRISDRAAPRYLRFAWFFRHVLQYPDMILAQSDSIREIFQRLGAPARNLRTGGNLKYDFQPQRAAANSPVRVLLDRVRPSKVWIAASTMPPANPGDPDEDDVVIAAFQQLAREHPGLLLILVPRRPERFDAAAQKLSAAGVPFVRRSALKNQDLNLPAVLLLDTIGELSSLFFLADIVFMGGTLPARGGHNILEPAFFARPIIVGPHMENFRLIAEEFRAADAVVQIGSAAELAPAVDGLLLDSSTAARIGQRALVCAESKRGATEAAIAELRRLYDRGVPGYRPALFLLLWPFARLWERGGRRRRARGMAERKRLDAPVLSIGNLSMGGTGKTPIVLYLAEKLKATGHTPGILTRGYGRTSPDKHLVAAPGTHMPVHQSGDEPNIFLTSGVAPVGIGPNRYLTGKMLEERFGADVLILDDGFQHARLERQVDIVLIDALDPFRGGDVFPVGRLREPVEELRRADIFVITRSDYSPMLAAIESDLRRLNPRAPIFHSRVKPVAWVDFESGREYSQPPFTIAGAFCGLGNPQSFWFTLRSLKIEPVEELDFSDHHRYRPREMRNLAHTFQLAGADALLTTEKDAVNLCDDCAHLIEPLRLYWLKIRAELDREAQFLHEIELRLTMAEPRP
jgi:3-deoxy-D-manno-octulosonic-acid transferase